MILSTSNFLPGKVIETKGIVRVHFTCSLSHAKKLPQERVPFLPFIKYISRPAMAEYLYHEVDEQLKLEAEKIGANAIHSIHYEWPLFRMTIHAFGTAVVMEPDENSP